jgi:hypothetical protein
MINNLWQVTGPGILFIFLISGWPIFSQTTDPKSSHKDSSAQNPVDAKVDHLPQPIHKVMDTLQRIGNDVGEEISKGAGRATEVVNKAVRETRFSGKK